MTFESFLYKPNPNKVKEDRHEKFTIGATVIGLIIVYVLVYIYFYRGLLGWGLIVSVCVGLIKLKIDEINKKGASRFGSLMERLSLSAERLLIGDAEFQDRRS